MSAKAPARAALPPWAETLRQKYLAAEASTFVLYRNVFDTFLVAGRLHTLGVQFKPMWPASIRSPMAIPWAESPTML